ncbi:hypothetical protein VNO77_43007 [Canavalia gladiata]|uniref:Uncharacterized protein n=1 Tax=Canavalia gladiata TaxID=3824 RepID=A0AAN9JWB2_CANGL
MCLVSTASQTLHERYSITFRDRICDQITIQCSSVARHSTAQLHKHTQIAEEEEPLFLSHSLTEPSYTNFTENHTKTHKP